MNHWQPELGDGPRGAFSFGNPVTALNTAALGAAGGFQGGAPSFENGWNGLAGFLLGTPTHAGKSSQFIKMNSLENVFSLYVRDRWRATSKLTLNLGLRWELHPTRTRSAGMGIESYDPATNEVLVGGRGGIPQDAGVGYSKKLFAPRVGFAYQVSNSTHAIDMANYGDWTGFSWNTPSVFYRNKASAANNIPHMFQLGYVYEGPFGSGKKWAASGVSKAVLGDWQINGIFSAYQGRAEDAEYAEETKGAPLRPRRTLR